MNRIKQTLLLFVMTLFTLPAMAQEQAKEKEAINAKAAVIEHIKDSYEWHITDIGDKPLVIHLPVIVKSSTGFHVFCSSAFEHHPDANGYRQGPHNLAIATKGDNAGKIVELMPDGTEVKPFDISITKTVAVMFINVILLLACILGAARWYKHRKASDQAPKGFVGFIEMLVMYVVDEIIKPGVGKGYEKYCPYLLLLYLHMQCDGTDAIPTGRRQCDWQYRRHLLPGSLHFHHSAVQRQQALLEGHLLARRAYMAQGSHSYHTGH